jgi:hypothetical protein
MAKSTNMMAGDNVPIDYNHYRVHDGSMYHITYSNSLAAAANLDLMFLNSASAMHVAFEVGVGGAATIKFYENLTTSALGTTLTAYNMNRNSTNSTGTWWYGGPTWSTASEITLVNKYIGAASQDKVGVGVKENVEWDLKANTKYMLRITNSAGATITASINGEYYEV